MEVGVKQSNKSTIIIIVALIVVLAAGVWFGFAKNSLANSTPQEAAKTLVKALLDGDVNTVVELNYTKIHEQELKQGFADRFTGTNLADFTFTQVEDRVEAKTKAGKEIDLYFSNMNGKYYLTRYQFY